MLGNYKFYALLLILKINVCFGLSQFLNDTRVLDIADDVQNRRFASAQEKILSNKPNTPSVAAIVRHVYSNAENNNIILLEFARDVNATGLGLQILRAVYNEMTANNHSDPLHLMSLFNGFRHEVLFKRNAPIYPLFSPEIEMLLEEFRTKIKAAAKRVVKDALISNTFELDEYAQNVTSELFDIDAALDAEVMRELAHETYAEDVPAVQLAANMMIGSVYIQQRITFFVALYKELEQNNDLNNAAVQNIALYLRTLKKYDNYKKVLPSIKNDLHDVIRRMPICVRNLYFGNDLCLWNRGRSEYLYASRSQHNLSRRAIFTYGANDMRFEGLWNAGSFSWHISNVFFESYVYEKEYLYASTTDLYNPEMRHVLTWVDDGFVGDTSTWTIELKGDFCHIKNENFNEYLFVSDRMHAEKKRYVFTAIGGANLEDPDFQWQIRNCGF